MNNSSNLINLTRIATATKKSKCTKSKNGNHQWKEIGNVPGSQEECIYCNKTVTWKN
jgi:hypothetical protein